MAHISPEVTALRSTLIPLRRDLHQHPELGYQEVRTAGLIAGRLEQLGYRVRTGLGKTGVTGFLQGGRPGKTVLLRVDIDALPILEQAEVPWKSQTPGVMHACGHDGHTAIGLTVAEILAKEMPSHAGNVFFVFQPAEELLSGAAAMLRDGTLEGIRPDAAFSIHLQNRFPAGTMALRSGPVMTSADKLDLIVKGRGGHGANPHLAIDPVVAAAQIILALQTLVSRETPPLQTAVLSITTLESGTAFNIIPDMVRMTGTFRCYDSGLRETLLKSLQRTVDGVAAALRCAVEVKNDFLTPAVINDPAMTALAREVAGAVVGEQHVKEAESLTGSDDVAYFWEKIPGCYAFVGSAKTDGSPVAAHHNARFDIDESSLEIGTEFLVQATRKALAGN